MKRDTNGEARNLAIDGLREVLEITRAALHAEIACADGDLTNAAVVAATKRYQEACRDLALYEAPRPQPVHHRSLERLRH